MSRYVPSFVFFGVQGYSRFSDESFAPVAEVSGRNITRNEWEQAHQRSIENFPIGGERMPLQLVRAFGIQKQASARAIRPSRTSMASRAALSFALTAC